MKQLVDWSAAIWAGLLAGLVFLGLNLGLAGGLGEGVPSFADQPSAWLTALAIHFAVSIVYALLIAFVIHRGGLIGGVIGGGFLGAALYFVTFHVLTAIFPETFSLHSLVLLLTHLAFGAVVGGVYELFEVEEFVPVDEPSEEPA